MNRRVNRCPVLVAPLRAAPAPRARVAVACLQVLGAIIFVGAIAAPFLALAF